eukprot:TRINITY_DN14920_c0_g1_i1.p1 TRINITY_DN14920_c0_g1~~TRINITY_DN14920_c0_g1_i1.p1  ORF type:complete len:482 (+),score=107.05 TRINITY_DN14920_c0_g1_i1:156-1448(+)
MRFEGLELTEEDVVPLVELLQTRDFDSLGFNLNKLTCERLLPALAVRNSLCSLDLSGNRNLSGAALPHLSALTNLRELRLSNRYAQIPPVAFSLINLQALDLSFNWLGTLPPALAALVNLKRLDLTSCGLSVFPPVLMCLKNLEVLKLAYNKIEQLPDIAAQLASLQEFSLVDCALCEFPLALTCLPQLESLDLSRNHIESLPDEIKNMRHLKQLRISQCSLTQLCDALWELENLQLLDLADNLVACVPAGIGALQKLESLWVCVGACDAPCLPVEMANMGKLCYLYISAGTNSRFNCLPIWLVLLRSLKVLLCSQCPLAGVELDCGTLVTPQALAAFLGDGDSDDSELRLAQRTEALEQMLVQTPLRFLQTALMHFGPRIPLRKMCVAACVRCDVALAQLPEHIREEIERRRSAQIPQQERHRKRPRLQ